MYSGYGYASLPELTEVPRTGMEVLRITHKKLRVGTYSYANVVPVPVPVPVPGRFYKVIPVPRVLCHGRRELAEVPGTGMNVVQTLQKFRVRVMPRVWFLRVTYRTQPSFRLRKWKSSKPHRSLPGYTRMLYP